MKNEPIDMAEALVPLMDAMSASHDREAEAKHCIEFLEALAEKYAESAKRTERFPENFRHNNYADGIRAAVVVLKSDRFQEYGWEWCRL